MARDKTSLLKFKESFDAEGGEGGTVPCPASFTSRQYVVLACLAYANFWIASCFSLQAPFFPREAELKGATPTQYGFVFGVFELVIMITSPIFGKMVRHVSPKFLITAGVFVEGVACILFGLLDRTPRGAPFIGLAFAVRIVEGFGAAAVMTSSFTIIAAEFPQSVGKTFSLLEMMFGLGLIVGPTIGGALYEVGEFLLPFAVSGCILLLGALLCCFFLPNEGEQEEHEAGNLLEFFSDIGILMNSLAIVTSLLFIGFNSATLEPHLRQFKLSAVKLGTIFIITGGIYALTTPFWGWLCDKGVDTFVVSIMGYCFTIIGMLFIGPVPFLPISTSLWLVIISLFCIGLGMAAKLVSGFVGAMKNTLNRGFPDNITTYGTISAMFAFSCSLGAFIGPSLGGYFLDTIGYQNGITILFAVEVFLMMSVVVYLVRKKYRKRAAETSEKSPLIAQSSPNSFLIAQSSENSSLIVQSSVKR